MELLAPVGSKESFITALRAGANAVYAGVPEFNARASAANINLYDLKVMIDHAHEKGVKVFLALNTLIKHEEISAVVKSVDYISRLAPDAVIVQDMGLAGIIRRYYPSLELHASTQMAVHNRMGVDVLAGQGFKRVILARELSFSELKAIANGAPAQLEVFCHGALCFSLSGQCLFSSFIGGLSGNRGRCTQPCRRLWENGSRRGYLFSPRDLELAEHIGKLKKIGIASLKIEGRMRSSEYVYRVVKAYRLLIDAPAADAAAALGEAKRLLAGDMAREKTACLFSGRDADIFQPQKAQCLGNRIGEIREVREDGVTVMVNDGGIVADDYLRLSNPATDTTIAFRVREFAQDGAEYRIPFGKAALFAPGNPVYKTIDAADDQKNLERDIDAMYRDHAAKRGPADRAPVSQAYTALISSRWKELRNRAAAESLWIRFDDLRWLDILPSPAGEDRRVWALSRENLHTADRLPADLSRMAAELPPFISQREVPLYRQAVNELVSRGLRRWVLNNAAHFGFFEGVDCELVAGQFLYTWNAYTAAVLAEMGVRRFTVSWEDDFLNIRKLCGPGIGSLMVAYLYGYVPVARSRILTRDMLDDTRIRAVLPVSEEGSAEPAAFRPVFGSECTVIVPDKAVSLFNARRKFAECGISAFGIDLSWLEPDRKTWNGIFAGYKNGENPAGTVRFNFKREVK